MRTARLAAVALLALGACQNAPSAPPPVAPPPLDITFVATPGALAGDSAAARGVEVRVAVRDAAETLRSVRVTVSDASGQLVDALRGGSEYSGSYLTSFSGVAYLGASPGRYSVEVVATDHGGRTGRSTATRVVEVADARYAATVLPGLGADAGVHWISAGGTVAGWVALDRRRPAVWRNGVLQVLPVADGLGAEAVRVNDAGDVLLQIQPDTGTGAAAVSYARVRTAEGQEIALGPLTTRLGDGRVIPACCNMAADLTESRVALGSASRTSSGFDQSSQLVDLVTGRRDSVVGRVQFVNASRQTLGSYETGSLYSSLRLTTSGFALPSLPDGALRAPCDPSARRFTRTTPLGLDDDANVLVDHCGTPAYLAQSGASRWLDRAFGPGLRAVRLARTGGVVAALDTAGTLWLWRAATGRTTRVRIAADGWQIDALGAVNGVGAIAAHGVERTTGRRAALLLTASGG